VDTRTVSFVVATFSIGPAAVNVTQILGTAVSTPATAGILDVNVKNIDNDAASASGTVTFPNATLASTANITAGTITTVTTLTNLPAITSNWLTAAGIAASALNGKGDWNIGKTGYALSSAGVQAIWDALTSALTTVGSIGKLLVDRIDAAITSRASQTSVDTIDDFLDTEVAAILADTNELQTDWADGGRLDLILDARASQASVDAIDDFVDTEVAAILAAVDTEVGAIKTKTDQLTFTVANQVDANALTGGGSGLTAAQTRAAIGLASANLDTQLDALPTAAENATAVLSAASSNPIDANVKEVNDVALQGDGAATPWGPV